MLNEAVLVLKLVATTGTYTVDSFHVLDQFVGYFEHLFTMITRQKLTAGLMLPIVYPEVEFFTEGNSR